MKVLVLGAGKMIEAILVGLCKNSDLKNYHIYSPSGKSAERVAKLVGAAPVSDLSQFSSPDWILIGCKPQQLNDLKVTLANRFKDSLYVSILAAVSEEDQLRKLDVKKLIRVMPNLAVEFNKGVTLLSSTSAKNELASFHSLFSTLGPTYAVDENELDELTLLTGSGPAFFYQFAQELSQCFTSLTPKMREQLTKEVLGGAAVMALSKADGLGELKDAVTSKGGVTIEVLNEWGNLNLSQLVQGGIKAGKIRSTAIRDLLRR